MTRGVRKSLVSSVVLVALIVVAGCSHYLFAEREPWRHEAEVACLDSGAVQETPARVRISAINGPGVCGMDYPLKISALGESAPLGYTDEPPRPPGSIPPPYSPPLAGEGSEGAPQQWSVIQSERAAAAPRRNPVRRKTAHRKSARRSTAHRNTSRRSMARRIRITALPRLRPRRRRRSAQSNRRRLAMRRCRRSGRHPSGQSR